ncbi:hypothetical protein DMN91_000981, partial [Ooceraea biroi]
SVSDYELLPQFGLSTDLLMIARLPMVRFTVWRIPVSDYEPLQRVWSCPPTFNDRETAHVSTTNHYHEFGPVHRSFNDRETAHGDAFNGLAHSSLRLRTITTSLVLSTDLLMIARLPRETHSTVWRIPVSDYEHYHDLRTTNHYHEFGPVHRSFNDRETAHGDAFNGLAHSSLDYEPLPRVWSCPPTFNDRETAHGDAFNGLAHSSLRLRTITTSLVLSTDLLMIARLPTETHSTVWRIPVSDYEPLPRVWSCHRSFDDRETGPCRALLRISVSDYELLPRSQTTNHYHEFGPVHRLLMIARLPTETHSTVWRHSSLGLRTITTSLVLSTDLLMIARLPTVTHSTVWRIPVSDYEPLPRVWSCPPTFNDRETAHGDAFNGLAHSSLGLRTITTSLVLFTDHLMIARLSMPMRFWRISVSDYELLPRVWSCPPTFNDRETAHGDALRRIQRFGHSSLGLRTITTSLVLSTDLLMIARLPTVTHSTVWRIPVSDYEPLPRVWSCPPTFNDRETAHGDAFNGLAHSSLGLRTITTSLVLSTDHLMIARLSMSCALAHSVSDYELLPRVGPVHRSFDDRETVHADALLAHFRLGLRTITTSLVLSTDLLMIARLPMVTHSTVWRIPVSDYEPLPRVWSCPPTFNDRETAHGDAFNGLAHSSLRLRTITTSLVLSTDLLMIARLPTETHSTVWRIPVSDYEPLPRVWSCSPII